MSCRHKPVIIPSFHASLHSWLRPDTVDADGQADVDGRGAAQGTEPQAERI
jgi:hypothetical protein